jgi:hypothetical protein
VKPTQEQIDKALETARQWTSEVLPDSFNPPLDSAEALQILDSSYRATLAESELIKRQYSELANTYEDQQAMPDNSVLLKHIREREAL